MLPRPHRHQRTSLGNHLNRLDHPHIRRDQNRQNILTNMRVPAVACAFLTTLISNSIAADSHPPSPYTQPQEQSYNDHIASQNIGDPDQYQEEKMTFPIAEGPFKPNWDQISQTYGNQFPAWFRQAKFGMWVHWGPQGMGRSGDWYAKKLYLPKEKAYENHLKNFGHPSEFGYKDVLNQWTAPQWDPEDLVKRYHEAGARYLIIMGVHHDNFDLWDSTHQPWNSVNIGPKRDILGEWAKHAKAYDMPFGVSFHHEYTWWWYQPSMAQDATGPYAGILYDGNLNKQDGLGQWWEGFDPRDLYAEPLLGYPEYEPVHLIPHGRQGIFYKHLPYAREYATQWALRIQDVIEKYDPDFIYTDGNSSQPFSGKKSGSGYKSDAGARVVAHYYNRALERRKKLDVFSVIKFIRPLQGIARTYEGGTPKNIKTDQAWIGERAVGNWFYGEGFTYDPSSSIYAMLEYVSRDGNFAVCISLTPEGGLDEGSQNLLKEIGWWMDRNSQGIYNSKAWQVFGEGPPDDKGNLRVFPYGKLGSKHARFTYTAQDFRFTEGPNGEIYAWCMTVPTSNTKLLIQSLGKKANLLTGHIESVTALVRDQNKKTIPVKWEQQEDGLSITVPQNAEELFRHAAGFCIQVRK